MLCQRLLMWAVCPSAKNMEPSTQQMIDYETNIKTLIFCLIFYIPLHFSICKDYHQMVFEYISIIIELSFKINALLTFN
jgi:hypothetical protein